MIKLTPEQQARFNVWVEDCARTHPYFAQTVRDIVMPRKLLDINDSAVIDAYLNDLDRALRAMRNE